jgi:hypothetical protein
VLRALPQPLDRLTEATARLVRGDTAVWMLVAGPRRGVSFVPTTTGRS